MKSEAEGDGLKFVEDIKETNQKTHGYRGYSLNGLKHGPGIEIGIIGNVYIGWYVEGYKHGKGKEWFAGKYYQGDFEKGNYHGLGSYKMDSSGDSYEGSFFKGLEHGFGVFKWGNNDDKFEGMYEHGKWRGQGTHSTEFFKITGEWNNNDLVGVGSNEFGGRTFKVV